MKKSNPLIPFLLIAVLGIGLMFLLSFKGLGDAEDLAKEKEGGGEEKTEETASNPEDIYASTCASCHGGNLEGGVGPKLQGVSSKYSVEEIAGIIENGKEGGMPGGLVPDDDSRQKLAEYIHKQK